MNINATLLGQTLAFVIFVAICWKYVWPPIWALFHILILALQAFIFMVLTIVYLAMAHETEDH